MTSRWRAALSRPSRALTPSCQAGLVGAVRVDLLGPLRLVVDGAVVEVRGFRRRIVVVRLALAEGRTVTADQLVDALWPEGAPDSGRQALHSHISRLRSQLGPAGDRLMTTPEGYRLDLGGDGLDVAEARALLGLAKAELEHNPGAAYAHLLDADELWRGPALAEFAELSAFAAASFEAEHLHREVTDMLIAAAVADGQANAVLGLAAAAAAEDPLRERAVLLQMQALAATGEASAALQVARNYRHRLVEEAGLDPSPALNAAERVVAAGVAEAPAAAGKPIRPATSLFGRDADLAALHRLLASNRLVSVVGPGGVGKTRVALEVARRADRATVLLLAPVTDPAAVSFALAHAMGLTVSHGDVLAACAALLADGPRLLVVDNCEHLLDATRDLVTELLGSCPRLQVLATSREPLGVAFEHVFRLGPLPTPSLGAAQDAARSPAVEVFLDRAARVRRGAVRPGDLGVVADLVRRLDGMPLAIELAAGRLSTFSLADLLDRLDRALDLLGGGQPSADARHRSLRATLEWSHQLLTSDEQRLFRHLAVFVDGTDLDTAEQVATDLGLSVDPGIVLARLVDASMLEARFTGAGTTRYRMLETLRTFGLDRLAAKGETDSATSRLIRWAVDVARWFDQTAATVDEAEADATLRRELANLRAAWRTARSRGQVTEAAAIVAALFDAVMSRDLVEVRVWARELADDPVVRGQPHAAAVFGAAAYAAYAAGEQHKAEDYARAGLVEGGDGVPHCRHALAVSALAKGAWDEALEHSLASDAVAHQRHGFLGLAALANAYAGDLDRARIFNARWLAEATSPSRLAWATYYQAEIENLADHNELAEQRYVEAITLGRQAGDTFVIGVATIGLANLHAVDGREHEALAGYRDVIDLFARTGYWTHQWIALRNLTSLLRRLGDVETAEVLEAAADVAPDAPAIPATSRRLATPPPDRPPEAGRRSVQIPGRTETLDIARQAIERHLSRPVSVSGRGLQI
jgi:predicted ATPase/DNA-binding SARP family transcriptional activator